MRKHNIAFSLLKVDTLTKEQLKIIDDHYKENNKCLCLSIILAILGLVVGVLGERVFAYRISLFFVFITDLWVLVYILLMSRYRLKKKLLDTK